jgi:D-alanyl-D-alanine-carboxypeptidase/D-alanyl-D-alanine-endopeptidase
MKKTIIIILLLLFVFVFLLGESGGAVSREDEIVKKATAVIRERVDRHDHRFGIVLGIIDAKGSHVIAYGRARAGKDVDGNSLFNLGSVAKLFTATLLAEMVERGEVKLDDPIEKFLPPALKVPSRNGKKITLLDLATHTSGLPSNPGNAPAQPDNRPGYVDYSEGLLYEFLSGYTLTRDIGSEYEYSNLGMGLLGFVLSRRAGKPLDDLLDERIWHPLEMKHTGSREKLTRRYQQDITLSYFGDGQEAPNWPMSPVLAGAGGFHSSVNDMLLFLAANMGLTPSPLDKAIKRAQQGYRSTGLPGGEVGLGWGIGKTSAENYLAHTGGSTAYSSFLGINRKLGRGVVILGNSYFEVIDIGVAALFDRLEMPAAIKPGAASAKEYEVRPEDRAAWGDYAGLYEISPGSNIMITFENGRLFLQLPRNPRLEMTATGEASFVAKEGELELRVRFGRDDLGKTTALEIEQGAAKGSLKKIPEPATVKVDPIQLAAGAGLYEISADLRLEISREGDGLYAQATMQPKVRIFPASESDYFSKLDGMRISFIKDGNGEINELIYQYRGQKKSGKRVQEKSKATVDPAIYADYVGQYRVNPRFTLTVTRENDRLFAQGSYQPVFELIPEGKDVFFIKTVEARVRFKRDPDNRVTQMVVSTASGEESGDRMQ